MKRPRKTALLKAYARTKTPFEQVAITDEMRGDYPQLKYCSSIFANSRIEAHIYQIKTEIGGVSQVNLVRHGDIEELGWDEIQAAIRELFGPEAVAVEIYPAMIDEWPSKTRVRVLWVLPYTWKLPFGLQFENAWGQPLAEEHHAG